MGLAFLVKHLEMKALDYNYARMVLWHFLLTLLLLRRMKMTAVLGSQLWVTLLEQIGWNKCPPKVTSNLSDSVTFHHTRWMAESAAASMGN